MYQYQVSFDQAIVMAFNNYSNFAGRSSRSEYWWFTLFCILVNFIVGFVQLKSGITWISWIVTVAFFLPSLGICVRRLHDIGKSGWWYLIGLVPIVGWILLLVWFTRASQPFENEYGPVPNEVKPRRGGLNNDNSPASRVINRGLRQ